MDLTPGACLLDPGAACPHRVREWWTCSGDPRRSLRRWREKKVRSARRVQAMLQGKAARAIWKLRGLPQGGQTAYDTSC